MDKAASADQSASVTVTLETQAGVILGTVSYMAPEQVRGQHADSRSDVFALGCVLFEMMTGQRPFAGDTTADVMAAILHGAPPLLSESGRSRPAALDRVIGRCLEKDPTKRFPSAVDLAAALRAIAGDVLHDSVRQQPDETRVEPAPRPASGPSVAVLPFVNMSSDPENEYFSDGLAEELINVLSKVQGLRVASRTSAFAFKGKNEDIRRIGEQLNVSTVLQGSVRKSGARLRITAQLAKVADGFQLWAETYNRQLEDVFAIQDEIAQSISKALRVLLTEKDQQALERRVTTDVRAYDCYLRGRQFFHQFRRGTLEAAIVMFGRAIEIDPQYARAYAGLADCYSLLYTNWSVREDTQTRADAASRKALELDPESGEAHTARGVALSIAGRHDEARTEFETAIRLDPALFEARYFFGRVCLAEGRLEEAAQRFEEASRLRPEDYQALLLAGPVLADLGRKQESEAAYRRGLKAAEEHLRLYPDGARALCLGATGWCSLGDRERALEVGAAGVGRRSGRADDAVQRGLRLLAARANRRGPRHPVPRRRARLHAQRVDSERRRLQAAARPSPLSGFAGVAVTEEKGRKPYPPSARSRLRLLWFLHNRNSSRAFSSKSTDDADSGIAEAMKSRYAVIGASGQSLPYRKRFGRSA